jgi:hypothetical protein
LQRNLDMLRKRRTILEKWFCPICQRSIGAHVKACDRCRCEKCGRPQPRDPHSCERDV